jgi:peroxiredoxin
MNHDPEGNRIMRILAFVVLGLLVSGAALAGDALSIGAKAPKADVQMKNVDGKAVTIANAAGKKGTLVVFTCNACPWVKKWEERLVQIGNASLEKGIGVIFVNSNDPARAAEDGFDEMVARSKKHGMKFAYAVDGTSDVARAFGATRTPEAFLFDARGKLVYHGTVDDNADKPELVENTYLMDAVTAVAAGGAVETAQTKALGCSIKFRTTEAEAATAKTKS